MRKLAVRAAISASFFTALLALGAGSPTSGAAQLAQQGPAPAAHERGAAHDLVVIVDGLRNDRGTVIGGLYADASHWLAENEATEDCHATIRSGRARCLFHRTDVATVAFAALHDEDGDGQLDRDFVGIPSEGYAFSNDVREPFGPPSFEAAAFSPTRAAPFVVHARYGL